MPVHIILISGDRKPAAMESRQLLPFLSRWGVTHFYSLPKFGAYLLTERLPLTILLLCQPHHRRIGLVHLLVTVCLADLRPISFLIFLYGTPLKSLKFLFIHHNIIPFQ